MRKRQMRRPQSRPLQKPLNDPPERNPIHVSQVHQISAEVKGEI